MPRPRFARPKLNGTVTVRRFQPPQLETEARISKGELSESLEAVASRVGLQQPDDTNIQTADLCLVDQQELALIGKMVDKGFYYISGGVSLPSHKLGSAPAGVFSKGRGDTLKAASFPPDCAVLWAFDPRMLLHHPLSNRSPETPFRLQRAMEALQQCERARDILPAELLGPLIPNTDGSIQLNLQPDATKMSSDNRARWIPSRFATTDEVYSFHTQEVYRDFIESGAVFPSMKTDVYCNEKTSSAAARLSVGAVIDASLSVLHGVAQRRHDSALGLTDIPLVAYCLVRPPGHHCTSSQPSGFCLVNNVAIAAAQLRTQCAHTLASGMPRVAILDLDVHFGEGTASFVEDIGDPQTLLYLSIHRYDKQQFYPFDRRGDSAYVGGQNGKAQSKGCIMNVAVHTDANNPSLCEHVISDQLMNQVFEKVFLPRLEQFQPDIVLVSLGFDAAYGDPLGKMAVEGGFASVVAQLKRWCMRDGRTVGLVVILEGGYNPSSVAQGVVSVGMVLSLPATDAAVQLLVQECPPRVWADLRQRQERQLQEWQQAQKKRADEDATAATGVCGGDKAVDAPRQPVQVADDTTLLDRHLQWCDSLIKKVKQIHQSALSTAA